jgi:hypothetical protein
MVMMTVRSLLQLMIRSAMLMMSAREPWRVCRVSLPTFLAWR